VDLEYAHAHAVKERALAGLRLIQLREKRREWHRVVDAGMAAALGLIRDRLLATQAACVDASFSAPEVLAFTQKRHGRPPRSGESGAGAAVFRDVPARPDTLGRPVSFLGRTAGRSWEPACTGRWPKRLAGRSQSGGSKPKVEGRFFQHGARRSLARNVR
jgi:hypothetical protein